ncbi:probable WRKY transcription factor 50 [Nymphaea colorata]|nr:probable WRKY transcription factor 50 [Nymphaea colorata]
MMKFCTELPAYLPENFPAADNGSSFQLPDILDFSDPLIDGELFEGREIDGNLQFPALDSSQPNKIGDSQANKQTGGRGSRKRKSDGLGLKVAFKTMSDVEVLDDGYRWRKYGKKMVKDNQNPRNYYRCSHGGGCSVKKRVERDRDDPRFVVTTYEGTHNHECPYVIYYITPQHVCDVGVNDAAQIPFLSHGAPYAGRGGFYLSNYIES